MPPCDPGIYAMAVPFPYVGSLRNALTVNRQRIELTKSPRWEQRADDTWQVRLCIDPTVHSYKEIDAWMREGRGTHMVEGGQVRMVNAAPTQSPRPTADGIMITFRGELVDAK